MDKDLTLIELIEWVWRKKILLILCGLIGAALLWGSSWLYPPTYRASVVILPGDSQNTPSFFNQFVGMAGLPVDMSQGPENVYQTIVFSNTLLNELIYQPTDQEGVVLGQQLAARLGVGDEREPEFSFKLKKRLREKILAFRKDDLNGVMTLHASIPRSPELAAETANQCVMLLDEHIQQIGERKGQRRTIFVKSRLEEIQEELRVARNAVTQFTVKNRAYRDSPDLLQKYEELASEAQALLTIWTGLREQLEMERIDAHGELNSLDVLDWAETPLKPISPKRNYFMFFGLFLGLVAGCLSAGFREARSA